MKKFFAAIATALFGAVLVALTVYADGTNEYAEQSSEAAEHKDETDVRTIAGTGSHGEADGGLAQFNLPFGVAALADGSLIVADSFNNLIRKVDADGYVMRLAGYLLSPGGDNFPQGAYHDDAAPYAFFHRPVSLAVNSDGWIFVADMYNHAVRVIVDGEVYTFAGGLGAGHEDGADARFNRPSGIAARADGYVFVADAGNHAIRQISPNGYVTTIAGVAGEHGFADGMANQALFDSPMGIALSEDGILFIADTGNNLIRKLERGSVSTFAGSSHFAVAQAGEEETYLVGGFADGPQQQALFNQPVGLAIWGGKLLVADSLNHSIRAASLGGGDVLTIAGTGYADHIDGGFDAAAFHFPSGLAVMENTLFVADTGNNMIRAINLENFILD